MVSNTSAQHVVGVHWLTIRAGIPHSYSSSCCISMARAGAIFRHALCQRLVRRSQVWMRFMVSSPSVRGPVVVAVICLAPDFFDHGVQLREAFGGERAVLPVAAGLADSLILGAEDFVDPVGIPRMSVLGHPLYCVELGHLASPSMPEDIPGAML